MLIRYIKLFFIIIAITFNAHAKVDDNASLKAYVQEMLDEGYNLFHDPKLSESEVKLKSAQIIRANLYLDWMAKYSLGRYRLKLAPDKLAEFITIYSDFVVKAYADLAGHYRGEKAILKNIKNVDNSMFLVSTEIVKPDTAVPIKVEYLVHKINDQNKYLVGDIITEGVSLLNSQQSEFNSVLSTNDIEYLIADIKKRINK